jgi:hypothetical protein
VTDRLAHAPHLTLAALVDDYLDQVRCQPAHARRAGAPVLEIDAPAQDGQLRAPNGTARHAHPVCTLYPVARVQQRLSQVAVVGEQDQAAAVGVEPSDWI